MQIRQWLRAQAAMRRRFVLVYGVLMFGGLSALLFTILQLLRSPQDFSIARLLSAWVVFPLMGIVWGLAMWWWAERTQVKRKAAHSDPGSS